MVGRELQRLKQAGVATLPGDAAFHFYETHGIPVEIIEEFAQEEGLALDRAGFDAALAAARARGQESWKGDLLARFRDEYETLQERGVTSEFVGYGDLALDGGAVVALLGPRRRGGHSARRRRGGARPHAVLRRVGRPGRRSGG